MFLRLFGLYCSACFGILFVSILCTCCSQFFGYGLISFTMFCAPVFFPNTLILGGSITRLTLRQAGNLSRGQQNTRKVLKRKKRTDTQYDNTARFWRTKIWETEISHMVYTRYMLEFHAASQHNRHINTGHWTLNSLLLRKIWISHQFKSCAA
jgi:hypothetical protein